MEWNKTAFSDDAIIRSELNFNLLHTGERSPISLRCVLLFANVRTLIFKDTVQMIDIRKSTPQI